MNKKKESKEPESMIMKGMVINWNLPSKATLQDWLRVDNPEIRIREIVELFPEEIFRDLEAIRRDFYRKVMRLVLPAYGLKLLPFEDLPKVKDAIEHTKKSLIELDKKIKKALKSDYYEKATNYYHEVAGQKPREFRGLAHRFTTMMMPLRLDPFVWDEFLSNELQKQKDRLKQRYQTQRISLDKNLERIQKEVNEANIMLNVKMKDIKEADKVLDEIYEPVKIPVDVATLKIERQELKDRIKELKYQERDLKRKLEKLERSKQNSNQNFGRAYTWAREETEKTDKAIKFDVKRLWASNLEELVRSALESLELEGKAKKKKLENLKADADKTLERIWSIQPKSRLIAKYEKFISLIVKALEGSTIKKDLEGFY